MPGTRMLLASLSPYLKKLLLGSQQLRGLDGDTIFVDVPGGEHALALVVEVRPWFGRWARVGGKAPGSAPLGALPLTLLPSLPASPPQALYSRRLRMSVGPGPHCVLDVLRVANFLDVRCVLDVALTFLKANLSASNALRVASLGEVHGLADVRAAGVEFVVANFEAMVGCDASPSAVADTGFVTIDKALLIELLKSDRLRVSGEMTVFRALMAWLDANDDLMAPPPSTEPPGQGQSLPLDDDAPHDGLSTAGADAAGCNPMPQPGRPCPQHLLSLIRFQHIPLELLYREVIPHPRLQSLAAKQMVLDTTALHFGLVDTAATTPGWAATPAGVGVAAPLPSLPPAGPADGLASPVVAEAGQPSFKGHPPRQYDKVDSRTVPMGTLLRVRDDEDMVRGLCDTTPADQPIKFVMRMKQTIGQLGRLMQKSRRGSLKLHFDLPELPDERRDFWYPAEALSYV